MKRLVLSLKNRFRVAVNFWKLLVIVSFLWRESQDLIKGRLSSPRQIYDFLFLLTIRLAYSIVKIVDILKSKLIDFTWVEKVFEGFLCTKLII